MNTSSLHALIIDQYMGELSPEVAELLETHLTQDADARAEAERIRQTLAVTQQAVIRYPELARIGANVETTTQRSARCGLRTPWLSKAAVIALLAGLAGAGGFFVGRKQESASIAAITTAPPALPLAPRRDSPWARYRIAHESSGGGLRVERVDLSASSDQ